jgi:hypothetical protein
MKTTPPPCSLPATAMAPASPTCRPPTALVPGGGAGPARRAAPGARGPPNPVLNSFEKPHPKTSLAQGDQSR